MKKAIVLPALALMMLMGTQSCKKREVEKMVETQTIDGSVAANERYVVTLPETESDAPYSITTQAQHASSAQLTTNSLGQTLLTYVPSTDFTGEDMLVVENDSDTPADKPKCGEHRPKCGNDKTRDEDQKKRCGKHKPHPKVSKRVIIKLKIAGLRK